MHLWEDESENFQITLEDYYKNSFDIRDSLKGSQRLPGLPGPLFENNWYRATNFLPGTESVLVENLLVVENSTG